MLYTRKPIQRRLSVEILKSLHALRIGIQSAIIVTKQRTCVFVSHTSLKARAFLAVALTIPQVDRHCLTCLARRVTISQRESR